ncbi:unnamed protein product [Cyprideis torosa]|uniref:Cytoplasmic tRNA 2-thiolation protein 1 n=1 Tax=Cyprideis torosa TaxID=163714 RepID=A0A7R8ZJ75_9CRUS|nr:unnamed protein product [Cyprideis torosa]CAG0887988.1 unnamed protein product [Cyprideis torosa]
MPVTCSASECGSRAILKRPKTGDALCRECFFAAFELEVHHTVSRGRIFQRGQKVAVGASGGKDSTVLAHVLKVLNQRYDYGLDLVLLSIDEGITGYRDDSLETVKRNSAQYDLPLQILSYQDLYGWTMDRVVTSVGRKGNCTFCGVFRRQALERGAALIQADLIVTGHNADDIAETVLMNLLRGDIARLERCADLAADFAQSGAVPRAKPLKYAYEKEIVMYAYFKKLDYFSTECIYSPNAYRGFARSFLKDLERVRPRSIIDIIHSGEHLRVKAQLRDRLPVLDRCSRCGHLSSQGVCKACVLVEGLNRGLPKLGIGKKASLLLQSDVRRMDGKGCGNDSRGIVCGSGKDEGIVCGSGKDEGIVCGSGDRTSGCGNESELTVCGKADRECLPSEDVGMKGRVDVVSVGDLERGISACGDCDHLGSCNGSGG